MYANLPFETVELWHAAGWTMIHFLWLGTLVAAVGLIGRLVLRHATPNVRYATALACLILLAALPIGIIGWLIQNPRPFPGGARGGFVGTAEPVERIGPTDQNIIELSDPANALAVRSKVTEENASGATGSASASSSQWRLTGVAKGTIYGAALESCVTYLPWLWIVGTPTTFLLLAAGIIGTRRLRRASRPIDDGIITETLAKLSQSLRITKRVTIAVCDRIAAPVLVGILRPIILLPPAALTGWSPDEIEMVLLHELAHVRRWDNLVNLVQRVVESLLFFHPAVWLISNWVRREREACCDAIVVARTHRPHAYAELLVALAAQLSERASRGVPAPALSAAATSAMAAGPLRARIRRILQLEDDPMLISGKSFAFMLATLLTAAAFAVLYLPTIGQAEQSTTEATESTQKANPPRDESTNADQTESSDKARIAGFEKALQEKISLIVVMFNDSRGYYRHLRRTYERLAREGKTIYLFGMEIDPASNEAKRYGIGPTPTLIIFRDGKETARLEKIENAEQLNEFVAATLGRGGRPKGKFPSLEDQKLADLSWKRLGLELEPIGEEDLQRVQALGYDGGLRVSGKPRSVAKIGADQVGESILTGDILVGLHVWPTTSLKAVAELLNRDDLAELSPLKFYVVRSQTVADMKDPTKAATKDFVLSGRIRVEIDGSAQGTSQTIPGRREMRDPYFYSTSPKLPGASTTVSPATSVPFDATHASAAPPPTYGTPPHDPSAVSGIQRSASVGDKSALRYDGKTFDEWRDLWKNELSTEKRAEAVKALAAFGRAGYGKEATEAILDVAGNYDFAILSADPEGKLKEVILVELVPDYRSHSLAKHWLPDLADRLEKDPEKWKWLAYWLMYKLKTDDPQMIAVLQSLARSGPSEVRQGSLSALIRASISQEGHVSMDEKTREILAGALSDDDLAMVLTALTALQNLLHNPPLAGGGMSPRSKLIFQPELVPVLFHADEHVQKVARGVLQYIDDKDAPQAVEELLAVLQVDAKPSDRLAAIRALGAMGARAAEAIPALTKRVTGSADKETLFALYVSIELITREARAKRHNPFGFETFAEELGEKNKHIVQEKMGVGSPEFEKNVTRERETVLPPKPGQLGGGGGGFF